MTKLWHDDAWADYPHWQTQDRKTLRRINKLLEDVERNDRIPCKVLFPLTEAMSMHPPLHRAVSEARTRGLGSSEVRTRCEAVLSESLVSIQKVFPCPGVKRNRPKGLRPALKRRMAAPRVHSA